MGAFIKVLILSRGQLCLSPAFSLCLQGFASGLWWTLVCSSRVLKYAPILRGGSLGAFLGPQLLPGQGPELYGIGPPQ